MIREKNARKLLVVTLVAAAMLIGYSQFGQTLSLENLAVRESQLRTFQSQNPWLVYAAAFLVYVLVAGLSLPFAVGLSLMYGWYFGFGPSLLLVSFASTLGASVAFLLSRYLVGDIIKQRFGDRLKNFNQSLKREGPFYLFTLRLVPVIPFFVINAVMGLTPIRLRTFWWVSQLGMIPGTAAFVWAGSRVPDLSTISEQGIHAVFSPGQLTQLLSAFALIGVLPILVRYSLRCWGHSATPS